MSAAGEVKLPPEHGTMTNGLKMSEATGFEYQSHAVHVFSLSLSVGLTSLNTPCACPSSTAERARRPV